MTGLDRQVPERFRSFPAGFPPPFAPKSVETWEQCFRQLSSLSLLSQWVSGSFYPYYMQKTCQRSTHGKGRVFEDVAFFTGLIAVRFRTTVQYRTLSSFARNRTEGGKAAPGFALFLSVLMCQRTVLGGTPDCKAMSLALFPPERDRARKR